MSDQSRHRKAAHQSAVSDILGARRKALEWIVKMKVTDNVDWSSPFINDNQTRYNQHPQKPAHAYTLLYAHNVANKAYWNSEKDLFTEDLKRPNGDPYQIQVPAKSEFTLETDNGDPETVPVTLGEIDTETETVSLETLNHRWEDRSIVVRVRSESPYYETKQIDRQVKLWLPPKAISLAFQQLDELAGSLEFLAESKEELPVWGFEEVDEDEHEAA